MNNVLFDELVESVREGGAILRGEKLAAREFNLEPLDIKNIRTKFELSQREFAGLLGISIDTLQNWEQGRRKPRGAARVLLMIAKNNPKALLDAVQVPEKS